MQKSCIFHNPNIFFSIYFIKEFYRCLLILVSIAIEKTVAMRIGYTFYKYTEQEETSNTITTISRYVARFLFISKIAISLFVTLDCKLFMIFFFRINFTHVWKKYRLKHGCRCSRCARAYSHLF